MTRTPRLAGAVSWAVLGASFGLSAATWIALARLSGLTAPLPLGTDLAWLMPVAIDGYVVVALLLWMAPVPPRVARFARTNTYAAAGLGVAAQSAYHGLTILADTDIVWRAVLAAIVGAMPPAVAALAVHMRALLARESATHTATVADRHTATAATPVSVPVADTDTDTPTADLPTLVALMADTDTDEVADPWRYSVTVADRHDDTDTEGTPTPTADATSADDTPVGTEDTDTPTPTGTVTAIRRHRHRAGPTRRPVSAPTATRDRVADYLRQHRTATAVEVARALEISVRTAERHLPAIRATLTATA